MNDQPIETALRSITVPCLQVRQPIGKYFLASISWKDLCEIADFDVRRVIQDERDVERYLGIQRPLNEKRVKQLKEYVGYRDAAFPTSIIVAIDQKCVSFDDIDNPTEITISNYLGDDENEAILFKHVARVLDGQHRIAGLYEFGGDEFELSVAIFTGIDIADQAQIFSTVNLEQTKVNKSLAYDLFALAKSRSPQKTCHNVAIALDSAPDSPFHERIKRLGVATQDRIGETITQATFVESLMYHITKDPRGDRDVLLRGNKLSTVSEDILQRFPLRNLFVEEDDLKIASLIENYFNAIKQRWPMAWDYGGKGLILNKTNGFKAAMRIFGRVYLHVASPGDSVSTDTFSSIFKMSKLKDDEFTIDVFPPGTGGEAELRRVWLREFGLE